MRSPSSLLLVVSMGIVAACGGTPSPKNVTTIPADARDVKVSLFELDCAECVEEIVDRLKKNGPVYAWSFDKKRVVLDVKVAPSVAPERVIEAAKTLGFRAELGDKGGSYLKDIAAPEGADVATPITDGSDVANLSSLVVAGKITIIDFYADWCGPCREVDKHVKEIAAKRADLAYRRLNVVDWDTPLAKHHLQKIPTLPYVLVFDAKGAQVDAIAGLDLARLDASIGKGKP